MRRPLPRWVTGTIIAIALPPAVVVSFFQELGSGIALAFRCAWSCAMEEIDSAKRHWRGEEPWQK